MTNFTDSGKTDNENVFDFNDLDKDVQELINAAIEVRKKAYIPYSGFAVGAALRSTSGEILTGCNVENAAFSPSLCAERSAIGRAVSDGHRSFTAIAVVAFQENFFTTPCGVCRQTLSEFAKNDLPIYLAKPVASRVLVTSIQKLLPGALVPTFVENNLNFKD